MTTNNKTLTEDLRLFHLLRFKEERQCRKRDYINSLPRRCSRAWHNYFKVMKGVK